MAQYLASSSAAYTESGGTATQTFEGGTSFLLTDGESSPDVEFDVGDTFQGTFDVFQGTLEYNGQTFLVSTDGFQYVLWSSEDIADVDFPPSFELSDIVATSFTVCFAPGTAIATPDGDRAVENLTIGDLVRTTGGQDVAVKWIGRQTVSTRFNAAARLRLVRVLAGSLEGGLPSADLTITADHGLLIDGIICHAGALVNGSTVVDVPLRDCGETYTVYHIETEAHELVLANGMEAETFIDNVSRRAFDNFAEYRALYGETPGMPEMSYPRATSTRMVPERIRRMLSGRGAA